MCQANANISGVPSFDSTEWFFLSSGLSLDRLSEISQQMRVQFALFSVAYNTNSPNNKFKCHEIIFVPLR
jgi:hypothetical protein